MTQRWRLIVLCGALVGVPTAYGCGPGTTMVGPDGNSGPDGQGRSDGSAHLSDGQTPGSCDGDTDGDGVADRFLGTGDMDGDGIPNIRDADADGDGRPNILEANAGRPYDCSVAPIDTDSDGMPDLLDLDSDNNDIPDATDFIGPTMPPAAGWAITPQDTDRDGTPDYCDLDDDGDRINDSIEIMPGTGAAPTDTDGDGTPDFHDLDSDGDTITDNDETAVDRDGDMVGNWRDLDSDGDTITDAIEAGDTSLTTPPVECAMELNAATLMGFMNDGLKDFVDTDSDNDGLSDGDEIIAGTNPCNPDTNGNGTLDSADVAYCHEHMTTAMHCATDPGFHIPPTDYYLILPWMGPQVNRELEFGTNIHVADVFFIFDTTGSMSSVQHAVAGLIANPTTGLIDHIRTVIDNVYFGVGHHDDFPTGEYGSPGTDRAIHPLCSGPPGSATSPECTGSATTGGPGGSSTFGGIVEQDGATHAMDVQNSALAIKGGSGNDGPESQVEALYQIVTNDGLYDHSLPSACAGAIGSAPCWVRPTVCPEGTWGYPCFREGSLAMSILFTDADFHEGARDTSPATTTYWSPYAGISPAPHNFDDMVMAYQRRSARIISINAAAGEGFGGTHCEGRVFTNHSMASGSPCFDMRMAAEGTGSVDLDGNALVYDMPATSDTSGLVTVVTNAVNTLATRVPLDITTAMRNDPTNPHMIDATHFIKRRVPSCQVAPTNTMCWTEPTGVAHNTAVARTDLSTFYRAVPGTRVRFTIYFQNDTVYMGDPQNGTLFHAFIDVLGDGVTRLDTRDVFILVPAFTPAIG